MRRRLILLILGCNLMQAALAEGVSVSALALFNERAMLSVDGGKPKIVRVGKTYKGVKLISSTTKLAVIEVGGKRESLTLKSGALLAGSLGNDASDEYKTTLELFVNNRGFFESSGKVNGRGINFLIDTGANIVVFNSQDADRLGLDYENGQRAYAATASGTAPMYTVTLDSVSIGGIELNDVQAGVIVGAFPQMPLLGMTFLRGVDMSRSGDKMRLTKR